jgi:hypothetical protein
MDIGATILGAMAIVLGLLMPVTLVGIILWYKARRNQLLHDTALKLAEKGQPVPPELFADTSGPHANLRLGVVLLMLGIGIALSLYLIDLRSWAFGIIPMFMGIGYLIVWKIESTETATK